MTISPRAGFFVSFTLLAVLVAGCDRACPVRFIDDYFAIARMNRRVAIAMEDDGGNRCLRVFNRRRAWAIGTALHGRKRRR